MLVAELSNGKSISTVLFISLGYLIVAGISGGLLSLINYKYIPELKELRKGLLMTVHDKALSLPYEDTENPEILNKYELAFRATSNFTDGAEGIYTKLFSLGGRLASLFLYIGVLSILNAGIGIIILVNTFIAGRFVYRSLMYSYSRRTEKAPLYRRERYLTRIMSYPEYGKDIRIYSISGWLMDKLTIIQSAIFGIDKDIKTKEMRASLADSIVSTIRDLTVYTLLLIKFLDNSLSMADLIACFSAVTALNAVIKPLIDETIFIKVESKRITYLQLFLALPDETIQSGAAMPDLNDGFTIEFKNLGFSYPRSDKPVFENLSLTIKKGQKLAVIGINGAGKTTLLKLLLRIYIPTTGEILLNGVNIDRIDLNAYRNSFSFVLQDINLYAATLEENIALTGAAFVDSHRAQQCLEKAGLGERLARLDKGLKSQVLKRIHSDGVEFSGGERQKLIIARALYRNSEVLIMDEPTAALDAYAEFELYKNFAEISAGKTLIFVSHRLASTQFCDKILLLDGGIISESGTHDELIQLGGKYREMFAAQMKYYKDDTTEGGAHSEGVEKGA